MEYDKNEIYEKYKNMVYKLSIQTLKKNLHTTTYKIDDLINVAWIAVIDSFRTFKNDKGAEIETYIYNNINFKLKDFIRFNIYSVYVPNSTLFNLNYGYDRMSTDEEILNLQYMQQRFDFEYMLSKNLFLITDYIIDNADTSEFHDVLISDIEKYKSMSNSIEASKFVFIYRICYNKIVKKVENTSL